MALPSPSRSLRRRRLPVALLVAAVAFAWAGGAAWPHGLAAASTEATILGSEAQSLDPVVQSDAGSAQVVAQLFDSLTAIDADQHVQPALASSWETIDGGNGVRFHLRPDLKFSDGSPLRAGDVVNSWLRLVDPAKRAALASLLDDVVGARDYAQGKASKDGVGLKATTDLDVEVRLLHPAADFPAIASSPSLSIVPARIDRDPSVLDAGSFVGSGGYVVAAATKTELTLEANEHYWAGAPKISKIHLLNEIGGRSPVSDFEDGKLDYTPISIYDASWIAYDETLGPSLRTTPSAEVFYYGFDTTRKPFSDVHARRAFSLGVDWRTIVSLDVDPSTTFATSMVPPGLPGRSENDFAPKFDVAAAKQELAAAGYADPKAFPKVTMVTSGGAYDDAIVRQLRDNLGIDVTYETLDFDGYWTRLTEDPPAIWSMGWVADYPGADDFLGLLLGTGKTNNFGRWSSKAFDAAIEEALSASDPAAMQAGFDRAQTVVRDEAPVIPVSYGSGYALARGGLLGAVTNGQGIVRYAGLAWGSR